MPAMPIQGTGLDEEPEAFFIVVSWAFFLLIRASRLVDSKGQPGPWGRAQFVGTLGPVFIFLCLEGSRGRRELIEFAWETMPLSRCQPIATLNIKRISPCTRLTARIIFLTLYVCSKRIIIIVAILSLFYRRD